MTIVTEKYVRKPLYVDAVLITEENFDEVAAWCEGKVKSEGGKQYIHVLTHNPFNPRQTKAFVGDWLLLTQQGYKIYVAKAFIASFDKEEPAEDIEAEVKRQMTPALQEQVGPLAAAEESDDIMSPNDAELDATVQE